jgi:hypothetical protein
VGFTYIVIVDSLFLNHNLSIYGIQMHASYDGPKNELLNNVMIFSSISGGSMI